MSSKIEVQIRRIYDDAEDSDGIRILTDRSWPRGLRKDDADLDHWVKDVAPSPELRKWYGHDPKKLEEFTGRYRDELGTDEGKKALHDLLDLVKGKKLTLLTSIKDIDLSHTKVLASVLRSMKP